VGVEHPVKGQSIYAYVTLMSGTEYSAELKKELVTSVRRLHPCPSTQNVG
jgi:acetyl-CoA synthetase